MRKSFVGMILLFGILIAVEGKPQTPSCIDVVLSVQSTAGIGETIPISLTLTNCSSHSGGFYTYLRVFDPCDGMDQLFADRIRIKPGQTIGFSFNYTVPNCPGVYQVQGTSSGNQQAIDIENQFVSVL